LGGLPVAVPVVDVHSVGAGGGSLSRMDAGGALLVGPESSGAVPGPVCYGRGGTLPTVTDANLLLGRLDTEHFLGGTFALDVAAAERAFVSFLRQPPGRLNSRPSYSRTFRTPLELAQGIIAVVNASMERALRVISVERGHDPRDFALICFGGAGGLHAADLARALGMTRVIVPQNPGGFSALGVLLSDIVKDVSQSVLLPVPSSGRGSEPRVGSLSAFVKDLNRRFAKLERTGRADFRREGFPPGHARIERRLDVRYVGQAYELSIPFSVRFTDLFHRQHERVYGHAQPGRALEVVNLRARLTIPTAKPQLGTGKSRGEIRNWKLETGRPKLEGWKSEVAQSSCSSNSAAVHPRQTTAPSGRDLGNFLNSESLRYQLDGTIIKRKSVWFKGTSHTTPFYSRDQLPRGLRFRGPAVVGEYSSTTVVPPDYECVVDEYLNLVLARRDH
jgi:N-methylhydantoinase A